MIPRRVACTLLMLFLLLAAGVIGWRALHAPGIVRAQQSTAAPATQAQTPQQQAAPPAAAPQAQTPAEGAIKAETREVRVDVVVTDKKGNYVEDLTTKDFRVYEDDKQQTVNSFSFGADPNAPIEAKRHYMVLFFDNSSMELSDQPRARAAAGKFIDAYAGADRVMAVVNFGGTMQFAQNFTTDATRLHQAVSGISTSSVSPNSTASNGGDTSNSPAGAINTNTPSGLQSGMPNLGNAEGDFGAYTLLLSLRQLAKSLAPIPGRKSLILFTAGFELNPERFSELTATIDACNKANVAVYPMDVRGLVSGISQLLGSGTQRTFAGAQNSDAGWNAAGSSDGPPHAAPVSAATQSSQAGFQLVAYHPGAAALVAEPQHGGGGGAGGGAGGGHGGGGGTGGGGTGGGGTGGGAGGGKGGSGGTGGGTGGGKGGTGGGTGGGGRPTVGSPYGNTPYNQARQIVPQFPPSASTNQQVMYALASGTGGFPILNTNDLMSGLEKIAREQSQYYLLGYAPAESPAGSCHALKVKVERSGTTVRSRSGFCNIVSNDLLAGKPIEKEMESRASAAGSSAGNAAADGKPGAAAGAGSLEAPFFYTAPNEARVHLAMEVPVASIDCPKVKGKYHADVNVLGIAYRPDGTVASRFSDEVTLDMEKDQWEKFTQAPMQYQNQFSVAPGQYRLSVVVSGGGDKFAKFETPLTVDPYDGKKFSLSAVALSNQFQPVSDMGSTLDADLLADRAPLVVRNLEITPSADNRFKKTDKVAVYTQIYAPQLADATPPTVKCTYLVLDPKTGKTLGSMAGIDMAPYTQKGNPVIPVALKLPLENFPVGEYTLKIQASQSDGALTQIRTVNFVVE